MAKKTGKAASKARRAAQKEKDKKNSSSSSSSSSKSSSSSSKSSSNQGNYETTDGKKFTDKTKATAHQKDLNSQGKGNESSKSSSSLKGPTVNTHFDSKKETAAQYNARVAKEYEAVRIYESKQNKEEKPKEEKPKEDKGSYVRADDSELRNSEEFKALGKDDQEAVLAVFNAVASNDAAQANRLAGAFKAATKMNDPFFNEQLRLATDAIERGYVAIDDEAEFKEMQLKRRRDDVRNDYEKRKEFLTLEQASDLRAIERQYTTELDDTRQSLAATERLVLRKGLKRNRC